MFRPRVMPCLLLSGGGLVKTVRFRRPNYIGDPINAVRIYNEKHADELVFLDIDATRERRGPSLRLVEEIGEECSMPFAVGGGIDSVEKAGAILQAGAEKVVVNTAALEGDDRLVRALADDFGSQAVIGSVDAKRSLFGGYGVRTRSGRQKTGLDPVAAARRLTDAGAGEIMITSIDREGTMSGYDLELIRSVADAVAVPVIASGGAGSPADLAAAVREGHASAVAAGSLFVYHGARRGILIDFPEPAELLGLDWGTPA